MKVDVSKMMVGQQIQVSWRKQPILIIRHSPSALSGLASVTSKLADPNSDSIDEPYKNINATRSLSAEYSVLSGVCTHLGCSLNIILKSNLSRGILLGRWFLLPMPWFNV